MIRDAAPADAPRLVELMAQLGYPATSDEVAARLERIAASPDGRALVEERNGRIVGLVGLHLVPFLERDGRWCRITALVVDEAHRGEGVGRALVQEVERLAHEGGCSCVEVSSGAQRADAHAFYERLGYQERRRRFQKWFSGASGRDQAARPSQRDHADS